MLITLAFLSSIVKYLVALIQSEITIEDIKENKSLRYYINFILIISLISLGVKINECFNNEVFLGIWLMPYIILLLINLLIKKNKISNLILLIFNIYMFLVVTDKIYPIII